MLEKSQRNAALVAGFAYPLTFLVAVVPFYLFYVPLLVSNNDVATVSNFAAHEETFRFFLLGAVVHGIGAVVLLSALYFILRPINQALALLASVCQFMYAAMWFVQVVALLGALHAAGGTGYSQVFGSERLQTLAALRLASAWDAYYVGLGFYGLANMIFCYLWLKSRYVTVVLSGWGLLSSLFMGFCAFAYLLFPGFSAVISPDWYEPPLFLFELGIGVWILARGLRAPQNREG